MNKFKGNIPTFFIVVLFASLISVIYLNIASLADDYAINSKYKNTDIHFRGGIIRHTSYGVRNVNQDVDFPNSDFSENYHSPLFNKRLPISIPLQQSSTGLSTYYATNTTYPNSKVQLHLSMSPLNFTDGVYRKSRLTSNNPLVFKVFNSQTFTLNLFPRNRTTGQNPLNLGDDSSQQHTKFHFMNSIHTSKTNLSLVNYYGVQNDFVDPGDPPDSDVIPVPNGTFFLLFLLAIYTFWKIKHSRE